MEKFSIGVVLQWMFILNSVTEVSPLLFHYDPSTKLNMQNGITTMSLPIAMPYYGAMYNYTRVSENGFIAFNNFDDNGHIAMGKGEVDNWPMNADPAIVAVFACPQKDANTLESGVYAHVVRQTDKRAIITSTGDPAAVRQAEKRKQLATDNFHKLKNLMTNGVAGGRAFEPDTILVVSWIDRIAESTRNTWINSEDEVTDQIHDIHERAIYQLVWASTADASLSYMLLNYEQLSYYADDVAGNNVLRRCKATLNGGNMTGEVLVDPTNAVKANPAHLMQTSGLPHAGGGLHIFRVDDIAYRVGCLNKTAGTYPMTIYPNVVNMLGEHVVEVNAMCLDDNQDYVLFINKQRSARCTKLSSSLARCKLPMIWEWGTMTVYFQPMVSAQRNNNKAFVANIYTVPPTNDPMRAEIGHLNLWYDRHLDLGAERTISWHEGNFTDGFKLYTDKMVLQLIGYSETMDYDLKKVVADTSVLIELDKDQSSKSPKDPKDPYKHIKFTLNEFRKKTLSQDSLHTYRFGFLRVVPQKFGSLRDPIGSVVSSPIPLHWLWHGRVADEAANRCMAWFNEDGAQTNMIKDTEESAPCPCKLAQAQHDYARFMPHPRCSKLFRDAYCTENMGSADCFMSAQNVNAAGRSSSYGQVCCYNQDGFLMHSNYKKLISTRNNHYNPGWPTRAHEFGTPPYDGQFQVPGLSSFYHDIMPYYFCCQFSDERCQLFYWRRPTSGCQNYKAPLVGSIFGGGHVTPFFSATGSTTSTIPIDGAGVFTLIYSKKTEYLDEVLIQVRFERYPDKSVDIHEASTPQSKYVKASAASVLTGVAIQVGGATQQPTYVLLRKDTRRVRYRTMVIDDNTIRYFDTVRLQRFKGVTVYINDVKPGQSELYITVNKSPIGLRIRESFAVDLQSGGKVKNIMESPGFLDLVISKDSELKTGSGKGIAAALMDSVTTGYESPVTNYLNPGSTASSKSDLFAFRNQQDEDIYGLVDLIQNQVFGTSADYISRNPTALLSGKAAKDEYMSVCVPPQAYTTKKVRCMARADDINAFCGSSEHCEYDYALLGSKMIAEETQRLIHFYKHSLADIQKPVNSCGPMEIDWPEYLKFKATTKSRYLAGDEIQFACYHTHWIGGDDVFRCTHDERTKVTKWNQGTQPFCRSRAKDKALKWLTALIVTFVILALFFILFCLCWMSAKRRNKTTKETNGVIIVNDEDRLRVPSYLDDQRTQTDYGEPRKSLAPTVRKADIRHTPVPPFEMSDNEFQRRRRGTRI